MIWILVFVCIIIVGYFVYKNYKFQEDIKRLKRELIRSREYSLPFVANYEGSSSEMKDLGQEIETTLREQEREVLRIKKELEEYQKLVANISHDLRTPLTSLLGYLDLSKRKGLEKRYFEIIEERGKELQERLEKFYFLSLQISEQKAISKEYVNVTKLLKERLLFQFENFESKGLKFLPEIPEETIILFTEPDLLVELLDNVLENMLRYGKNKCGLKVIDKEDFITLDFYNHWEEIESGDLDFLFGRTVTFDSSRESSGTGLGLAIVKGIMDQLSIKGKIYSSDEIFHIILIIPKERM